MSASTIEQGTPEWHAIRCGKVTASRVADIMRKTKTGISATRQRYLGELVAERMTGKPTETFKSKDMEWGNATEEQARSSYEFVAMAGDLVGVTFVDHPKIMMSGASPDRLVGNGGLLEVKCPATHTHIATLLGERIEPDYLTQMQWQMACTGRAWCDFVSFDPRMPEDMRLFVKRIERDPAMIADLEAAVSKFLEEVSATVSRLEQLYRTSEAAE